MTVHAIIALAGRAGSGKDTAAEALREPIHYAGKIAVVTGFARRLKGALSTIFDFSFHDLTREEKEAKLDFIGKSPRELMQTLGTEWGRAVHPDLWVKLLERELFDHPTGLNQVVILTDCRFQNEVAWVRAKGGSVWWVERDGITPVAAHPSENAIGPEDCDHVIRNFGTCEDLARETRRAWEMRQAVREMLA